MDSVHTNEAKIRRYPRLPPLDWLRLSPRATQPPAGRDHSCHLHGPLRTLFTDPCSHTVHPPRLEHYKAPGASTRAESQDRAPRRTPAAGAAPQHAPRPQLATVARPGCSTRTQTCSRGGGTGGTSGLQNPPAANFRSWGRDQLTSGPAGADGTVGFRTRGRGAAGRAAPDFRGLDSARERRGLAGL